MDRVPDLARRVGDLLVSLVKFSRDDRQLGLGRREHRIPNPLTKQVIDQGQPARGLASRGRARPERGAAARRAGLQSAADDLPAVERAVLGARRGLGRRFDEDAVTTGRSPYLRRQIVERIDGPSTQARSSARGAAGSACSLRPRTGRHRAARASPDADSTTSTQTAPDLPPGCGRRRRPGDAAVHRDRHRLARGGRPRASRRAARARASTAAGSPSSLPPTASTCA